MPEQKARQVRATYRRQVSDGSYGTEAAEVMLEWWIPDGEDDAHLDLEIAQELLDQAAEIANNQLRRSSAPKVRSAVGAPKGGIAPARTAATVPADDELPF